MKKIFICLFLILIVLIGCGIVYASIVPGIDEPYDPPNYYSPTSISYPDSAPSIFTLRDLASQGGNVFDYKRNVQEILSVENKINWLTNLMKILGLEIIDTSPADTYILTTLGTGRSNLNENIIKNWKTSETYAFMNSKYFRNLDEYNNDGTANYDKSEQYKEIDEIYKQYAKTITDIRETEEEEAKLILRIQEASETAKGEMELRQLLSQLDAIQASLNQKKNMLLGLYIDLRSVNNKIETDEAIEKEQKTENMKLIVENPNDRSDLSKKQYEKPKPIGFIQMK